MAFKVKNYFSKILFLTIIILLLTTCQSEYLSIYIQTTEMEEIDIEVLKPAKKNLPLNIFQLLVCADTSISDYTQLIKCTEEDNNKEYHSYLNNNFRMFIENLIRIINEAPKYHIINDSIFKDTLLNFNTSNWDYYQEICMRNNSDAILLIKNFKFDIYIIEDCFYDYPYYYQRYKYANRCKASVSCKIIDPFNKKIIDETNLANSRYWENRSDHTIDCIEFFNQNKDLLDYFLWQFSLEYGNKISPVWKPEKRKFYGQGNKDFSMAYVYTRADNWEGAKNIWLTYRDSKKRNLANYASYNLALAYEMEGNLDKALEYANSAVLNFNNYYAKQYVNELKERIEDQKKLKAQLEE